MAKTAKENLIHIKFDYEESQISKKELLSTELSLVKINKSLINYKKYRLAEIKTKQKLKIKISELLKILRKITNTLPQIDLPKKQERQNEVFNEIENLAEKEKESEIEKQLNEIKRKLRELEF